MTTMSSSLPRRAQTDRVDLVKAVPIKAPTEVPPGYVAIPASMIKLVFGLLLLLAVAAVIAFGLLWTQNRSFSHQLDNKNTLVDSLDLRISNLGARTVQLQQEIDGLIARSK